GAGDSVSGEREGAAVAAPSRAKSAGRRSAAPSPPRASAASSARASWLEWLALALVFLIPVVFDRRTQEIFEVPKVTLLVTGALALGAVALAGALGALATRGSRASEGPFSAVLRWPRRDPLG